LNIYTQASAIEGVQTVGFYVRKQNHSLNKNVGQYLLLKC